MDEDDAQDIVFTLRMKGYITKQGQLTQQFHDHKQQGTLDFGEDYNEYMADIVKRLDAVFNPNTVKPENARQIREAKFDSQKFERKEFQELWRKINRQTYYTVDFKTEDLIQRAVIELDNHLRVSEINIQVTTGTLNEIRSKQELTEGTAMKVTGTDTRRQGTGERECEV